VMIIRSAEIIKESHSNSARRSSGWFMPSNFYVLYNPPDSIAKPHTYCCGASTTWIV